MKREREEMLKAALGVVNPFAFRTANGGFSVYTNAQEAYQFCIQMLWAEFPRGFVDIPLFMNKYQGVSLKEAETLVGRKQYALLRIWDNESEERVKKLREVLTILLRVSGVALNESLMLDGLYRLDMFLEKQGVSGRTESGVIVDFIHKTK